MDRGTEAWRKTSKGAAAVILGRGDQCGDGEKNMEQDTKKVVLAWLSNRKLLFHPKSLPSSQSPCLHCTTTPKCSGPMLLPILANWLYHPSHCPARNAGSLLDPSLCLPKIQGLGTPAYSWGLALSIYLKGDSGWGHYSLYGALCFCFWNFGECFWSSRQWAW